MLFLTPEGRPAYAALDDIRKSMSFVKATKNRMAHWRGNGYKASIDRAISDAFQLMIRLVMDGWVWSPIERELRTSLGVEDLRTRGALTPFIESMRMSLRESTVE